MLLQQTPWSTALAAWLWWPARLVVLVALALVGMRLGLMLRRRPAGPAGADSPAVASALMAPLLGKLLVLPAAMLLLAGLLDLPSPLRDAVVLQAAAPTAISVLLLTEAAAAGPTEAAAAGRRQAVEAVGMLVLWSTALALVSVPLWWWLLSGPLGS